MRGMVVIRANNAETQLRLYLGQSYHGMCVLDIVFCTLQWKPDRVYFPFSWHLPRRSPMRILMPSMRGRVVDVVEESRDGWVIKGVRISRSGPSVSHLFFADDSLLFCKATREECNSVLRILDTYELSSN